jgi:hypothetical protein
LLDHTHTDSVTPEAREQLAKLGVGGINSVAGDHFGARELQANFKAVTKKKGILLFLREGTRGSYSLEKYWGPCNLAESCRVRGRALCIFKAVTKKKGILLFLREGNRCSYSLEKCWGPCNLAESCRESCSTRLARLIPPTPMYCTVLYDLDLSITVL